MSKILESELILNKDGSVYHLNLLPEDIAETIITVGDPDRVAEVSRYFDTIEIKKQKREFVTHTGYIGNKRISVISTGISTDNIDIVLNELDALVNIDLSQRTIRTQLKSLDIVRIGTAGGLQPTVPVGSFVVSQCAVGLDGLACYYQMPDQSDNEGLRNAFIEHFSEEHMMQHCYAVAGDQPLVDLLGKEANTGITVTCGGFYGPQGRTLRGQPKVNNFIPRLQQFVYQKQIIMNFEMETAGIYAMGQLLGHQCCSISAIVANRFTGQYDTKPTETIDQLIRYTLEQLIVRNNMALNTKAA